LRFFPFTAIVEQGRLKQALLLNAVNPAVGGVLVVGPAGTGKSTAVRGLAELLPEIDVVADCPFSCSPSDPCPVCSAREGELPVARRRRRIVDLPLNATEDRVAGTVDIARALREGERALEPGLLAEANRGILYVDEINLLDDHLTDILLDAAALGVNVVEREGISVSHPARFLLVGTMNEEEGELRPQIADRIGLRVEVDAVVEPEARGEIVRRREAFTVDGEGFAASWADGQAELADEVAAAERLLASVTVPALRHRIEDLDQLVPLLLGRLAPRRPVRCTPDAMRALLGYVWPGNVAQLQMVLREALARRPAGDLRSEDLPADCFTSCQRVLMPMEALERDAIIAALHRAGGNRLKAAADLGIARSSLYRKIHSYGIGELHLPPPEV